MFSFISLIANRLGHCVRVNRRINARHTKGATYAINGVKVSKIKYKMEYFKSIIRLDYRRAERSWVR